MKRMEIPHNMWSVFLLSQYWMQPGREESCSPALFLMWFVSSSLLFEFSSSRAYFCLRRAKNFCVIEKIPDFPTMIKTLFEPSSPEWLDTIGNSALILVSLLSVWSLLITQLTSTLLKQKHKFLGFILCHPLGQMLSLHGLHGIAFSDLNILIFFFSPSLGSQVYKEMSNHSCKVVVAFDRRILQPGVVLSGWQWQGALKDEAFLKFKLQCRNKKARCIFWRRILVTREI